MFKQRLKRLTTTLQNFAQAEDGVSAIEFIMVAPIIFLVMGVTLETGFMLFTEFTLQAAVEDAARIVRTGQAQDGNYTAATFKTKVCDTIGFVVDCGAVTVYVRTDPSFATMKANLPPLINIGPATGPTTVSAPTSYAPGGPSQPAIIIATYDWSFVTLGMGPAFGNVSGKTARRLIGVTLFQNQKYS